MSLIRPPFSHGDPRTESASDLVRPGTPPARVITPLQIHILRFWNEPSAEEVLANYASRAMHLAGETLIGGIAAASVADLAGDRAHVAPTASQDLYSLTISITSKAKSTIAGAGIRLIDLRGTKPTKRQLAEMVSDRTVSGALVSHDATDADRPSWRIYLKPGAIRRLEAEGLIHLDLGEPKKRGRIRNALAGLTKIETTTSMLRRLVTTCLSLIGLLLVILGAIDIL